MTKFEALGKVATTSYIKYKKYLFLGICVTEKINVSDWILWIFSTKRERKCSDLFVCSSTEDVLSRSGVSTRDILETDEGLPLGYFHLRPIVSVNEGKAGANKHGTALCGVAHTREERELPSWNCLLLLPSGWLPG